LLFQDPASEVLGPHGQQAAVARRGILPARPKLFNGKLLFVEPPKLRSLERRIDPGTVDL
jgi:hypothetical protein